jgi:hypothetical protein
MFRRRRNTKLLCFDKMPDQLFKEISLQSNIDFFLFETKSIDSYRKQYYCRPIRIAPDGCVGIFHKGRVYPLLLDEYDNFIALKNLHSYDQKQCHYINLNDIYSIPYAWPPKERSLRSLNCAWKIGINQFGIYIYIKAEDDIVEQLALDLINKRRYRVVSWGEIDQISDVFEYYDWYIKLSSGLSFTHVSEFVNEFFNNFCDSAVSPDEEVSILSQKLQLAEEKLHNISNDRNEEIENLSEELILAYEEVSTLNSRVKELYDRNYIITEENKKKKEKVRSLKKSYSEKIIAKFLISVFPNLAFSPSAPKLIVERFTESVSLWKILQKLNNNIFVERKVVRVVRKHSGWFEIAKHIATGKDNRGRLYVRPATEKHFYDVVVHWKNNSSEQTRFFKNLVSYSYFSGPDVVFL